MGLSAEQDNELRERRKLTGTLDESLTEKNARLDELKRLQGIVISAIKAIAPDRKDLVSYVQRDPASLLHDHEPEHIVPSPENTINSNAEKLAGDFYTLIHTTGDDFKENVAVLRQKILTGIIPQLYREAIPYDHVGQEGVNDKIEAATLQFATGQIDADEYKRQLATI